MTTITKCVDIEVADYEVELELDEVLEGVDAEDVLNAMEPQAADVMDWVERQLDDDDIAQWVVECGGVTDQVLRILARDPDTLAAAIAELTDTPPAANVTFDQVADLGWLRAIKVDGKDAGFLMTEAPDQWSFRVATGTDAARIDTGLVQCHSQATAQALIVAFLKGKGVMV